MLRAHHELDPGVSLVQNSHCHRGSVIENFQGLAVGRTRRDRPLVPFNSLLVTQFLLECFTYLNSPEGYAIHFAFYQVHRPRDGERRSSLMLSFRSCRGEIQP